jgi:hypothetical protein
VSVDADSVRSICEDFIDGDKSIDELFHDIFYSMPIDILRYNVSFLTPKEKAQLREVM